MTAVAAKRWRAKRPRPTWRQAPAIRQRRNATKANSRVRFRFRKQDPSRRRPRGRPSAPLSHARTLVQEKREEPASAAREVSEPVREAPVQEAKSENTESAAAIERRANARKNLLRKKREDSAPSHARGQ